MALVDDVRKIAQQARDAAAGLYGRSADASSFIAAHYVVEGLARSLEQAVAFEERGAYGLLERERLAAEFLRLVSEIRRDPALRHVLREPELVGDLDGKAPPVTMAQIDKARERCNEALEAVRTLRKNPPGFVAHWHGLPLWRWEAALKEAEHEVDALLKRYWLQKGWK